MVVGFRCSGSTADAAVSSPGAQWVYVNGDGDGGADNLTCATSPSTGSAVTLAFVDESQDWQGAVAVEVKPAASVSTESGAFNVTIPAVKASLAGSVSAPTISGSFAVTIPAIKASLG
jgi:hypothetical protein